MIIRINLIIEFGKVIIGAIVLLFMLGTKDYFVEIFTAKPEAGGIITWAVVMLFGIGLLFKARFPEREKDETEGTE